MDAKGAVEVGTNWTQKHLLKLVSPQTVVVLLKSGLK